MITGGGLVSRGGVVFLSVSRVCHISLVSGVSISNCVSDSLGTTIGEEDAVLTVGSVSITRLFLVEVHTGVVVIDSVVVSVVGGLFVVCWGGFVGRGGPVNVVGGSNGQEGKSKDGLKEKFKRF